MIYFVSGQQELFPLEDIKKISVEESLKLISSWGIIQADSETSGRDPRICKLLCFQFGNLEGSDQVVVDCTTISILKYKEVLESHYLIFHNAKFDLQFLYNYSIIPRKIYDTMIVEQLLYLGFPHVSIDIEEYEEFNYTFPYHEVNNIRSLSFALDAIALKRLHTNIDKTVRGEIIWRGLDLSVIKYAAGDVRYLGDIMQSQKEDLKTQDLIKAAKVECDFVPAIAYLEWCGVHLDENKWKNKMEKDKKNLEISKKALDSFVISNHKLSKYTYVNNQGDLFSGWDLEPKCIINWSSSKQVVKLAKELGFNTVIQDKKTGEDKDSVLEKALAIQKGINDEFLKLYFDYQGYCKVVTSFGQGHLNAINPKTNRIHTIYRQLGAASGRMSCGSQQSNTDLAKLKGIPAKDCTYPNLQQLPHDEETRSCFTAEEGNLFISCDYSAQEGRVQGDIYQDEAILKMYREGIDGHSMYAKIFFKDELEGIDVHDVKKLRPDLRTKAKSPEFALAYGGGYTTIMQQLKCSEEEALKIVKNYEEGFKGTAEFAKRGSAFVRQNGYILMCKDTGHKMYWWDYKKWMARQKSFTKEFWEDYRNNHKNTGDSVALMVSQHCKAASKYDRLARNAPPQGTSSVMTKTATTNIFNWIVDNGYFGIILLCVLVHDETNWEFPKIIKEFPNIVKSKMEEAAALYCKSINIPAEASVGDHWIH